MVFVALVVLTAIAMTWVLRQGYAVHRLTRGVGDTWFLSADGRRWFRMDEHQQDVPLAEIPVHLQHAFIAVEDHRFYTHPGVDPIALGRAVVRNIRAPGTVEGGSTLTQQLARTLFLSNKTILRPQGARGGAGADDRRAAVEGRRSSSCT